MNNVVISPDALNRFRQAASQAERGATPPVSRWLMLKDDIAALRQRGLSYRAISDLLSQNGISASPSGLMRFCRNVLKEKRSRKPSARQHASEANLPASPKSASEALAKTPLPSTPVITDQTPSASNEINPYRTHGPHIAKLVFRKTTDKT